jgi:excisionase family DNA binding protein
MTEPDNPAIPAAELLNIGAVATMLACSERHVYRLSDSGRMPRPRKLGALVRWHRKSIMDWIEAGCPAVRRAK